MPQNKFHEDSEDIPQAYGYIDNDDADELLGYSYNWDEEDCDDEGCLIEGLEDDGPDPADNIYKMGM